MLSESTKQFINASGGGTINNLADDIALMANSPMGVTGPVSANDLAD